MCLCCFRCSTCPLLFGCCELSQVIILKLRREELFAKLSKLKRMTTIYTKKDNSGPFCEFAQLCKQFFLSQFESLYSKQNQASMKQDLFTCLHIIRNNSSNKAFCLSTSFFLCFIHCWLFCLKMLLLLLDTAIITIRKYNQLTSDIFPCFISSLGVFFCDSLDLCYDPCHVIKHES